MGRAFFSIAVSPVSPCTHQLTGILGYGAAGAFTRCNTACRTCSLGHLHTGGLVSLPTYRLYIAQLRGTADVSARA